MTECAPQKVLSTEYIKCAPEWATNTEQGGLLQAFLVYVTNVVHSSKDETYTENCLCAHKGLDRCADLLPLLIRPLTN